MTSRLRWLSGEPELRARIGRWLGDPGSGSYHSHEIARSPRRNLTRLREPDQKDLLIKHFRADRGPRRIRSSLRAVIGQSAWQREWWGLNTLWQAGVPVPRPLALARSNKGDAFIVCEFIEGPNLWNRLRQDSPPSDRTLEACALKIAAMHEAGVGHGDLHPGNLLLSADGPVLIDFQRSAKIRPRTHITDLARMHFSLALSGLSVDECNRFMARAQASEDAAIRPRVQRRAQVLSDRHRRRRMRESLREGADRVALRLDGHSGLRRTDVEEETLRVLLAQPVTNSREPKTDSLAAGEHDQRTLQARGRQFHVHRDRPRTILSRALQSVFGSSARRIWRHAHDPKDPAGGARLLAFGEQRAHGVLMGCFWIEEETLPAQSPSPGLAEATAKQLRGQA